MLFLPVGISRWKQTTKTANENLSHVIQAEVLMDEVMYQDLIHVIFSHAHRLPSSLSDSLPEDNQMKHTVTLNRITDVSGFGHC